RLETPGLHTVRVRVDAPGDAVPQNNALDAATVASPPGRVLLVTTGSTASATLGAALARDGLDVRTASPSDLPADADAYGGADTVVLDDVPATALTVAQQRALRDAVAGDGLGLLAVGGAGAFGAGGYAHTPLEAALPVRSTPTPRPARASV